MGQRERIKYCPILCDVIYGRPIIINTKLRAYFKGVTRKNFWNEFLFSFDEFSHFT